MQKAENVVVGDGQISFELGYRDNFRDQGVSIQVKGEVDGKQVQLLRFDCFDHDPHYHYGPEKENHQERIDQTTEGDPLDWSLWQIRNRLPTLIERAGYEELALKIDTQSLEPTLDELEATSRKMSREKRSTVIHNRGDVIVESGPVRFGLEYRHLSGDRGIAIHVLGDVGDEEQELLTFDCFDNEPHYHYGPRAKNQRLYLDKTVTPDPLEWALSLFKGGKLGHMLERAGYSDHAARLNPATVAEKVAEVERVAHRMRKENPA